jgi:preprotein translocase subunit SecF
MELIKPGTKIDFVGWMKRAVALSAVLMTLAVIGVFYPGPNWGIDFAGGGQIEVAFKAPTPIDKVRDAAAGLGLGDVSVQEVMAGGQGGPTHYLLRFQGESGEGLGQETASLGSHKVESKFAEVFGAGGFTILAANYVGPKVGAELRESGIMAVIYAMGLLLIYITLRFELRYAVGAVAAIIHDVLFTVGAFLWLGKEFDLTILAALLTIAGFSLNDTIVIFDRVRENVRRMKKVPYGEMINITINETLSRTILTTLTVIITVLFLFLLGGSVIHNFALAMLLGCISGTYSTIYIATVIVMAWENVRAKGRTAIIPEKKEA